MKYLLSLTILISILSGCHESVRETDTYIPTFTIPHSYKTHTIICDSFIVVDDGEHKLAVLDKNLHLFLDSLDRYVYDHYSQIEILIKDRLLAKKKYSPLLHDSTDYYLDQWYVHHEQGNIFHYMDSLNHLKKTSKKKHKSSMVIGGIGYGHASTSEDSDYINRLAGWYITTESITDIDTNTIIYDKATGIGINDLVPVIMQVSDTSIHYMLNTNSGNTFISNNWIEWINGYEGYKTYHDDLPGIRENIYLDENKKPLSKSIVVWTTKPRQ